LAEKTREIQKSVSTRDPLRIAILAGILIADELHKERESVGMNESESEEVERITRSLINRIDETLGE
jgi:cell division protein ZapA (FtsZ GTPase activity inhibitor)